MLKASHLIKFPQFCDLSIFPMRLKLSIMCLCGLWQLAGVCLKRSGIFQDDTELAVLGGAQERVWEPDLLPAYF